MEHEKYASLKQRQLISSIPGMWVSNDALQTPMSFFILKYEQDMYASQWTAILSYTEVDPIGWTALGLI